MVLSRAAVDDSTTVGVLVLCASGRGCETSYFSIDSSRSASSEIRLRGSRAQYGIRRNGARRNFRVEVSFDRWGQAHGFKGHCKAVAFLASKSVLFATALEAHLTGSEMRRV